MITRDQAEHIATQFVGVPASDPEKGWDLEEFDAGWLIQEKVTMDLRGAASYVIERASGRVMSFPSYVPPDRILEEYDQVVASGFPENLRSSPLRLTPGVRHQ
ncbi:MAG: hypothetical protein ABSA93_20370 [Streptosporangiaceae bacterium]|jgi:hypothetical protein